MVASSTGSDPGAVVDSRKAPGNTFPRTVLGLSMTAASKLLLATSTPYQKCKRQCATTRRCRLGLG